MIVKACKWNWKLLWVYVFVSSIKIHGPLGHLYEFPSATVTSYHKFIRLKQRKFTIWWCWRSDIQNEFHRCWLVSFGGFMEKFILLLFLKLIEAVRVPWLMTHSSIFKSSNHITRTSALVTLSPLTDNPRQPPYIKTLNHIRKIPFAMCVRGPQDHPQVWCFARVTDLSI